MVWDSDSADEDRDQLWRSLVLDGLESLLEVMREQGAKGRKYCKGKG